MAESGILSRVHMFLQVIQHCIHVQCVLRLSNDENMCVTTTFVLVEINLSSVIFVDRALHPSHTLSVIVSTTQVSQFFK
jgi:hypothetical protein